MTIWRLKKHADRRIKTGHPWVMKQELDTAPRNFSNGSPVELQDDQGRFVARGYGNTDSSIVFRALSFDPMDKVPHSRSRLIEKLLDAWKCRQRLGFKGSFRLCFSEGDGLSGLIVDRYVGGSAEKVQVFAVQILTAGMQTAIGSTETFFKDLSDVAREQALADIPWERTAVVLRNDVRQRIFEGLEEEPARFVKSVREADFTKFPIELNSATGDGLVAMECDLFQGQKTGFFLDQTANISLVCDLLSRSPVWSKDRPVRVLDLCCYVGHWSTQITRTLRRKGLSVEVTQVDVSAKALEFAKRNAEREGAVVRTMEKDVFKAMDALEPGFDIIIADPPAFIKSKKDLSVGQHAYVKMNAPAFKLATPGGLVVSCSCSGLLNESDFKDVLGKSLRRSGREARCIARGGPAPDHPGRMGFPEGMYLKMFVHQMV